MPWYPNGYVSGAKPTAERKQEYSRTAPVGHFLLAVQELLEKRKARRKLSVEHLTQFYDGHHVLREGPGYDVGRGWKCIAGRFAKDTSPLHKRPKRIPWDKKQKESATDSS